MNCTNVMLHTCAANLICTNVTLQTYIHKAHTRFFERAPACMACVFDPLYACVQICMCKHVKEMMCVSVSKDDMYECVERCCV